MVNAGLWDDVDVNISWHPSAKIEAGVQSSLALVDFMVEFFGQAAHASADPWNGRSVSDALEPLYCRNKLLQGACKTNRADALPHSGWRASGECSS